MTISTAHIVEQLSIGYPTRLSSEVEEIILKRFIDTRECSICAAPPGDLCRVFGGYTTLLRTHPARLTMTARERASAVHAAIREVRRRALRRGDDTDVWLRG